MEIPCTYFASECSVTLYADTKSCDNCKKTYEKYCKFLVVKCCGERGRYCFKCDAEGWSIPCQKCRGEGRSIKNNIRINKWKSHQHNYEGNYINFNSTDLKGRF